MIKGQAATIPFRMYAQTITAVATGKTPTVKISKDGGALTPASGTAAELDSVNAPGMYTVTLTAAEMNADVILLLATATGCIQSTVRITTDPAQTAVDSASIAEAVLAQDCEDINVTNNGYTLKHLIMASQKSATTTDGVTATWTIKDTDGTTIATRSLTLNDKGAISATN